MTTGLALALGVALVQPPVANAVSSSAKAKFISSLVSVAQKTQMKFGVPASVQIAQAIEATDWGTSTVMEKANNYFDTPCSATMTAKQFATLANDQVGKPYVLGAETSISDPNPPKFDCSELVQWLFGRSGNPITDLAAAQYNVTKKVTGSPKVGDLVFLRNNPARSNGIGHVAVVTKQLKNGGWRIIEARGHVDGVVRTTLAYWKQRSYYAGLRRYPSFALANGDSIHASAAGIYKSGCTDIDSVSYSKFSSMTNSFYGNAAAITSDSAYADARSVMASIPKFVGELAKVEQPKNAGSYAKTLNNLIATYNLTDYDVVPIGIVLESGDSGFRVTALQYLLKAAGYGTTITGKFDSGTVSAVKQFQKAKKLDVDGQVGKYTLTALFSKLSSDSANAKLTRALNALLEGLGYGTTGGGTFGSATLDSLKSFQTTAGRSASGSVDNNTWAALFMSLDSALPSIDGTAKVEQTLTADAGSWGPGSVSLSYQWYRGKTAISGAEGSTYDVQPADAGSKLSVEVSGLRTGYTITARTSATTAAVANATFSTTPTPAISGTAKVGETLQADAGTWKPTPARLAYQWLRGGKAISGATKSSYTVQVADSKAKLSVTVTASRDGYDTASKTSDATSAVTGGTLTAPTPKISGTAKVGRTLTAAAGTWSPSEAKLTYQWYRGSSAIKDATSSKYALTTADVNQKITVKVTGELEGYLTATKTSKATAKVAPGTLAVTDLAIRGKKVVGEKLRVQQTWSESDVAVTYQWYRNGVKLTNATKSTFTLTKKSLGTRITVKVTGKKSGYTTLVKLSAPTKKITR